MSEKTLAMLVLERQKVPYAVYLYDDNLRDAEAVAQDIGLDPSEVFKTLVVTRPSGKPYLVMIPANRQLDLKKFAREVGEKKVRMAGHREVEDLTGLQVGGISALALLNRNFVICLDSDANDHERICVSAGRRGLQLRVPVADLVKVTGARMVFASR